MICPSGRLGISYTALKNWILAGRIRTIKTPGGHHRIPVEALDQFLPPAAAQPVAARMSGRNQLAGTVVEVIIEGLLAKVVLAVGSQRITAIVTADAARDLALEPGEPALAVLRGTEVMVGKP